LAFSFSVAELVEAPFDKLRVRVLINLCFFYRSVAELGSPEPAEVVEAYFAKLNYF
jgi:hypothetical protein